MRNTCFSCLNTYRHLPLYTYAFSSHSQVAEEGLKVPLMKAHESLLLSSTKDDAQIRASLPLMSVGKTTMRTPHEGSGSMKI
jgi:hypothetical protein